jgi:hypothetical protein
MDESSDESVCTRGGITSEEDHDPEEWSDNHF